MKKWKMNIRHIATLIMVICLIVSFVGCSQNSAPAATTPAAASTPTQGSEVTAQPDVHVYGGTFIYADSDPKIFYAPEATTGTTKLAMAPAVETLGRYNSEGITEPFLAESIVGDPDAKTVTIKLPSGVKFHDGSDLTAEVVKFNFELYDQAGKATSQLCSPTKIEVTDPLTVVLSYDTWINNCIDLLGEVYIISQESFEKNGIEWARLNPVGTGPFVFDHYTSGIEVVYTKNENYRTEGQPYLDGVKLVVMTDTNAKLSAFKTGEIDALGVMDGMIYNELNGTFTEASKRTATSTVLVGAVPASKDPANPLNNVKVRQAIMYAMNSQDIATALTYGVGLPTNQFSVPGNFSYNENIVGYQYDLQKALDLMSEAGYADGFETTISVGKSNEAGAVALQSVLATINITANVEILDNSVLSPMTSNEGVWPGFVFGWFGGVYDLTGQWKNFFLPDGARYGGAMLRPDDLAAEVAAAGTATTLEEKKQHLQEANRLITDEYALIIPMYTMYTAYFSQTYVHDIGFFTMTSNLWTPELAWKEK